MEINNSKKALILSNVIKKLLTTKNFEAAGLNNITIKDFELIEGRLYTNVFKYLDKEIIDILSANLFNLENKVNLNNAHILYLIIAFVDLLYSDVEKTKKDILLKAINNSMLDKLKKEFD